MEDFLQRVHPDERQRVNDTVHAALTAGARLDVGYRIVRPSGEGRHVRARGEPLRADDGRTRYVGTVQDMAEQMRRERRAELNARLLLVASGIAHIGGWTYDTVQGHVTWSDER